MGKRGKRRRHNQQADGPAQKKISSESDSGAPDVSNTRTVQASYTGSDNYAIPSPLELSNDESSAIENVWNYLVKGKEWEPTPIQLQLWSILLEKGKSVVGIAPTGSGKTMAYGIPALLKEEPIVVLVPTRELVQQVSAVCSKIAKGLTHKKVEKEYLVVPIYGGVDKQSQKDMLDQVNNKTLVVIATPGRLLDLLKESKFAADLQPSWIILDEADQLSKDGDLGPQVEEILGLVRTPATKLAMISATYPDNAKAKFEKWIEDDYVLVQVNSVDTAKSSFGKIPENIKQVLHVCSDHKKPRKLMSTLQMIQKQHTGRNTPLGIIFFARIEKVKYVSKLLEKEGIAHISLHSQLSTQERAQSLHMFQSGKRPLLLATDIAARGINVTAVQYVIQYDFPSNLQQYIHRCGRAGRSGQEGTVYSFFTRNLKPLAADMISLLEKTDAWVDPNLRALVGSGSSDENKATTKPKPPKNKPKTETKKAVTKDDTWGEDDDVDDFPELGPGRIVLKRASHVSDPSSSEDEDGDWAIIRLKKYNRVKSLAVCMIVRAKDPIILENEIEEMEAESSEQTWKITSPQRYWKMIKVGMFEILAT